MKEDPWMAIAGSYTIWQEIVWKVSKVTDFWAFVSLWNDVNWLVHISEMEKWTTDVNKVFKVWQDITSRIIDINTKEHRVWLSVRKHEEKKAESKEKTEEAK
jgi:ribosomal protein S1